MYTNYWSYQHLCSTINTGSKNTEKLRVWSDWAGLKPRNLESGDSQRLSRLRYHALENIQGVSEVLHEKHLVSLIRKYTRDHNPTIRSKQCRR